MSHVVYPSLLPTPLFSALQETLDDFKNDKRKLVLDAASVVATIDGLLVDKLPGYLVTMSKVHLDNVRDVARPCSMGSWCMHFGEWGGVCVDGLRSSL